MLHDNSFNISYSWLLLGVVAVISLFWLWEITRCPSFHHNVPPCPVYPWPVIGHFLMLRGDLRSRMREWRKRAGDIYSLYLGKQLYIVVNDFDVIKEIMNSYSDSIVNSPHNLIDELRGELNTGIVSARDDNWREQRATSLAILRSSGMGKNLMANKIQEEVAVLCDKLSSLTGQIVNPKLLLNTCVSNIISSVALGERFHHEDPTFIRIVETVNVVQKNAMLILMVTHLKLLYYLPWDVINAKKWLRASSVVADFIKSYIVKFKKCPKEIEESENFITGYLKEMKKNKEKHVNSFLSESNLFVILRTLFLAGTESVAVTILWSLLYMVHNPAVQEKVYKEIVENIGTSSVLCIGDKQKLPYLNAVIMETQRLASVIPTGLRREVSSSFQVRGFTFPEGSVVWPILDSVHHDKNIWVDPENFRPERFIDKDGVLINREELIPYGIGKRVCIGEGLARMQLFLFMSSLLQRFKFEPIDKDGELPSLKESFAVVCTPLPFQLRVVSR